MSTWHHQCNNGERTEQTRFEDEKSVCTQEPGPSDFLLTVLANPNFTFRHPQLRVPRLSLFSSV